MRFKLGPDGMCLVHVSPILQMHPGGEQKTKPTQASVRELGSLGLAPDVIACRVRDKLDPEALAKVALFCNAQKV